MKKRIIASILVVVTLVLSLVGCAKFNFAQDKNLSEYVEVNVSYEEFVTLLNSIKIVDGEFTTDEDTRKKKVEEEIYARMAKTVSSEAENYKYDRLTVGKVGTRDVVTFCYYVEYEGKKFLYTEMDEARLTSTTSTVKATHTVDLGDSYAGEKETFLKAVKDALLKNGGYDFDANGAFSTSADKVDVAVGDTVTISFTVKENNGETTTDRSAKVEQIKIAKDYVNADPALQALGRKLAEIISAKNEGTVKIGSKVSVKSDSSIEDYFETEVDGVKYTFDEVTPLLKIKTPDVTPVSFDFVYDTAKTTLSIPISKPDSIVASASDSVNLSGKTVKVYVYPVYHVASPEAINVANIIRYALGSSITETSLDIFADESYKSGDKTVKALVADLVKIYADDYDNLATLKKAYDDAKTAAGSGIPPADGESTEDLDAKLDKALKDYTTKKRELLSAKVAEIAAAKKGENGINNAVVDEYTADVKHELTEAYNDEIISKVSEEVYKLIFENDNVVKVVDYPKELLKEFKAHIYETYEYEYYKKDFTTGVSNYSTYPSLTDYILEKTKAASVEEIDGIVEAEAKAAIDPLLKLYAISRLLAENGAADKMVDFVESDIAAGMYDASYAEDASKKEIKEAKKLAEKNQKRLIETAENFLMTNKAFKAYKKSIGRASYRQLEAAYGEINLRAAEQANNLLYLLTSTEMTKDDGGHFHPKYKTVEGADPVLEFRSVSYSVK